jgi:glycosyltransferase involved in cell wall biosynthesis
MRVIHFILGQLRLNSADGVQQCIRHLSSSQSQLGHDVAVFCLTNTTDSPVELEGVTVRHFRPARYRFTLTQTFKDALLAWKPDVVHLHSSFTPETAALANWLYRQGIPYVESSHGNMSREVMRRRWFVKFPYKFIIQRHYLAHAAFIHVTDNEARVRDYVGPRVPLVVACNAIDWEGIPPANPDWLLSRVPQARGKRIFLFLGRLDLFQKGLPQMIAAFRRAALPDWVLVLVGPAKNPHEQRQLKAIIARNGMQNRVFLAGPAYGADKWSCYAAAHVFIHTSRWEGGAFTALESAAMGLPILITPGADVTGVFGESPGAIRVAFEVAHIARGMQVFGAKSDEELCQMGARNRQLIQQRFDWKQTAEKLLQGYARYALRGEAQVGDGFIPSAAPTDATPRG